MASASLTPLAARPHRAALLVMLLAMLLAQGLGLVHASLHGRLHGHAQAPSAPAAADFGAWQLPHDCDEPQAHGPAARDDAFGHEAGSAECRLYDQIGHDWAFAAPWVAPPPVPGTPGMAVRPEGLLLAAQAAGYLARGPPLGLAAPT